MKKLRVQDLTGTPARTVTRILRAAPLPLILIVCVYVALAGTTLVVWATDGRYLPTGDEPDYLVMARGIAINHTFEQTRPYQDAFDLGLFNTWPKGIPGPGTTSTVDGPHGLYNVHNVGLPILISLPYLLGGLAGVRIFMVAVGALAVLLIWKFTGIWTAKVSVRALVTAAVGVTMPMLNGAGQIYPDMPAGVLSLLGVYWLLTIERLRRRSAEVALAVAVAYLPWLQIKFVIVAGLLLGAVVICIARRKQGGGLARASVVAIPAITSMAGLAGYNLWAFGSASGPYGEGSLAFSKQSLMVVLGLVMDQKQGLLLQNPINLVGVAVLVPFIVIYRIRALIVLAAIGAIVVPNGLHPNWYGGVSFSGRFGWTGGLMFSALVTLALSRIGERRRGILASLVCASMAVQAFFWLRYTYGDMSLYSSGALGNLLLADYAELYYPVQRFFPAYYDLRWASDYTPNFVVAGVVVVLICAGGVSCAQGRNRRIAALSVALVVASSLAVYSVIETTPTPRDERVSWAATQLAVVQGKLDEVVTVPAGAGQPGPVTFVPFVTRRGGSFDVRLTYSSDAAPSVIVGRYDVVAEQPAPLASAPLTGTGARWRTVTLRFDATAEDADLPYQFRTLLKRGGTTSSFSVQNLSVAPRREK